MASNALLIIGMAGIAGAIVLALYALGSFGREKVGVARSMAAIQAMDAASAGLVAEEYARPFGDRVVAPSYDKLSDLGRRLTPQARIERVQHNEDRRRVVVRLTRDGLKHLGRMLPGYYAEISGIMAGLNGHEHETLVEILGKVRDGLSAHAAKGLGRGSR